MGVLVEVDVGLDDVGIDFNGFGLNFFPTGFVLCPTAGCFDCLNCLGIAFNGNLPHSFFKAKIAKIASCCQTSIRKIFAGINFQGGLVVLDRGLDILRPIAF